MPPPPQPASSWPQVLGRLTAGRGLGPGQAGWAMDQIMTGAATPAQIAAFGVSMRMKGPTADEQFPQGHKAAKSTASQSN